MGLEVTGRYRFPPPDPAWLAKHVEPVIEPELPIVDAHHHLWDEPGHRYLLNDIAADVGDGHRIDATVFVEARHGYRSVGPTHLRPVGETESTVEIAAAATRQSSTRIAAAIVGFADLTRGPRAVEVIDEHLAVGGAAFAGIRHSVSRDPAFPNGIVVRPSPPGLLADTDYLAGLRAVASRGLSYDAMLYHRQIPELVVMARRLPGLNIVLDHAGCVIGVGPYEGREREIFEEWRRDMTDLACCPNVVVKLGGFGMVIGGARWHEHERPPGLVDLAEAWRPTVETCIELFGADRCMFESNFPVDKGMYSYRTLWNAFKHLTTHFSADERHALFSGTATRTYRIPAAAAAPIRSVAYA